MASRAGSTPDQPPGRTGAVLCPDWPVTAAREAAGVPDEVPAAVVADNHVLACSVPARAEGVRRGQRKRDAQGICPSLVLLDADPARDARAFEPVVVAVEEVVAGVEVVRPGLCVFAARGPVRFFGSEDAAGERLVDAVAQATGAEAMVGFAEGSFASALAAASTRVVQSGQTRAFLAEFDISVLGRPELVSLLRRLGVHTLGAFAALSGRDVFTRFGDDGTTAHRLAQGLTPRPLVVRAPPVDLAVREEFDPPLSRVDTAAFAARAMAERFGDGLAGRGLACTRLRIDARTEDGGEHSRVWRHEGVLSAAEVGERARWQLDGWLTARGRRAGGLVELVLAPDEVVEYAGAQLGLWGEVGEADERAHRALTRVQALLGFDAVLTPVLGGGRSPSEQFRQVPWREEKTPLFAPDAPWPGRLPSPAPATVPPTPLPATVVDARGAPLVLDARHHLSGAPHRLSYRDGAELRVRGWAGPWSLPQRWWESGGLRERARLHVEVEQEPMPLGLSLLVEGPRWWVEAVYD